MGNDSSKSRTPPSANVKVTAGGGGKAKIEEHLRRAEKTGIINLSKAALKDLPPSINTLANRLRTVDVSQNKIETLPAYVGDFSMLKQLNLQENRLAILPDEIGKLKKLELLNVQANRLTSLPDSMVSMTSLKTINLSHNVLATFPVTLCDLVNLDLLDLSHNQIAELPSDDERLSRLKAVEMNLNSNRLNNLNANALAKCERLRTLRIQENCLPIEAFNRALLADSKITLLSIEGNLFQEKQLQQVDGYEAYEARYTEMKKKMY